MRRWLRGSRPAAPRRWIAPSTYGGRIAWRDATDEERRAGDDRHVRTRRGWLDRRERPKW